MTSYNNSYQDDDGFTGIGTPWFKPEGADRAYYFGNPVKLSVKSESETKIRESRCKEDAGQAKDTRVKPKPATGQYTTDTFGPLTWALMMMGETAQKTKPAVTVADETAKAFLQGYFELVNSDIDESTLAVNHGGATLDAEHYDFKASMGYLRIKSSANINEGEALTVNYQTTEESYLEIDGQKVANFKGEFGIDGVNDVNGRKCKFYAPNASMSVNSDFDWYSDDYNQITADIVFAVGKNKEPPTTIRYYD